VAPPMTLESVVPPDGWAKSVASGLLANRTLLERLGELRVRLFKALGALVVCSVLAWFFYSPILSVLTIPLKSVTGSGEVVSRGKLVFTTPTEAFSVRLRVVMYAGAFLASPVIVWELWRFFAAGTRSRAGRYALVVVGASLVLFTAGGVVAFAFVEPALRIFVYLGGNHIVLVPRASEYISFLLLLIVAFGLTFEYPLFLLGLIMAGVINSGILRRRRRLAYFILLVVAAVVTPTVDPITPLALALPLGILYEATIVTARLLKR
jgi:sec-independent protein translocase protein TatC